MYDNVHCTLHSAQCTVYAEVSVEIQLLNKGLYYAAILWKRKLPKLHCN